jgi:hypothetical protein
MRAHLKTCYLTNCMMRDCAIYDAMRMCEDLECEEVEIEKGDVNTQSEESEHDTNNCGDDDNCGDATISCGDCGKAEINKSGVQMHLWKVTVTHLKVEMRRFEEMKDQMMTTHSLPKPKLGTP